MSVKVVLFVDAAAAAPPPPLRQREERELQRETLNSCKLLLSDTFSVVQ